MPEGVAAGMTVRGSEAAGRVDLVFRGSLDAVGAGRIWRETMRQAVAARGRELGFDLTGVEQCDTAGAALLLSAEQRHGGVARFIAASPPIAALLARVRDLAVVTEKPPPPAVATPPRRVLAEFGGRLAGRVGEGLAFLGQAFTALLGLPARRRMVRFADLAQLIDQAGWRALPLALLLGYLMGLILAFQSAIPMRRFGADLFVADLVSIALLRELGPLLAAVILAGRTGSAQAAELGTMKVNEELDALVTMGLDPMTLLVLPRLAAAMVSMPALVLALDIAGLVGMTTVLAGFGFPPALVAHRVVGAVHPSDLMGGIFRAVAFGAAVAAIGCRAGLATGAGPRAVGTAATRAVVGGIVATIALDGLFALLSYRLGL